MDNNNIIIENYILSVTGTIVDLSIPIFLSTIIAIFFGYLTAIMTIGRKRKARVIMFCTMFAYYGVTLGILIGASKESLIRDAFTTIITLFSSYLAFILSKEMHPRIKAMIPAAVICFLLSLLISATFISKINALSQ